MKRMCSNYGIACFILNILSSFFCVEAFSQDRENVIAELKDDYRIIRTEDNVKIVRYDGHDNEEWYMHELCRNVPSPLDVDRENRKLLKYALQKYKVDNSALLNTVRQHFSDKVDIAFISFIVSKSGRFEYLYVFLLGDENQKKRENLTHEYSDDKYYNFLQWMNANVQLTSWDSQIPYCRGAFRAR